MAWWNGYPERETLSIKTLREVYTEILSQKDLVIHYLQKELDRVREDMKHERARAETSIDARLIEQGKAPVTLPQMSPADLQQRLQQELEELQRNPEFNQAGGVPFS